MSEKREDFVDHIRQSKSQPRIVILEVLQDNNNIKKTVYTCDFFNPLPIISVGYILFIFHIGQIDNRPITDNVPSVYTRIITKSACEFYFILFFNSIELLVFLVEVYMPKRFYVSAFFLCKIVNFSIFNLQPNR